MISGFIDIASIYSALGVLEEGKKGSFTLWDTDCLLKVTSLLLHENILVLPPVKISSAIPEHYKFVLDTFPELALYTKAVKKTDILRVNTWLNENMGMLQKMWKKNLQNPDFVAWGDFHKRQSLVNHVIRHGSLFEDFFIPQISEVFNCPQSTLLRIHELSKDLQLVKKWSRTDKDLEEISLGKQAWLLGGIMRGKIYETVAKKENLQLLPHPFREKIFSNEKFYKARAIPSTEDLFLRMIIGCSLLEASPQRRIRTWIEYTNKARNAILNGGIELKNTKSFSESVTFSTYAAKKIGLKASSTLLRNSIELTFTMGLDILAHILIGPWAIPFPPAVQGAYNHLRNATISEDLINPSISTRDRFLKLASQVPGRIQYQLVKPHT